MVLPICCRRRTSREPNHQQADGLMSRYRLHLLRNKLFLTMPQPACSHRQMTRPKSNNRTADCSIPTPSPHLSRYRQIRNPLHTPPTLCRQMKMQQNSIDTPEYCSTSMSNPHSLKYKHYYQEHHQMPPPNYCRRLRTRPPAIVWLEHRSSTSMLLPNSSRCKFHRH